MKNLKIRDKSSFNVSLMPQRDLVTDPFCTFKDATDVRKNQFIAKKMAELLSKSLQLPEDKKRCFERDISERFLLLHPSVDLNHSHIFPSIQKIYYIFIMLHIAERYHQDTSFFSIIKKHLLNIVMQETKHSFMDTIKNNISHIMKMEPLSGAIKQNLIRQLMRFGLSVVDCTDTKQEEVKALFEYYSKLIFLEERDSRDDCAAGSFAGPTSTPYSPR